jgi:GDP/UDP-N,N'-diacetylbacillosamine 2-epimerase (hydrolysing)
MKKIAVITGSRAEYGLLRNLMKAIDADEKLKLQIFVTGMHLSTKHGMTKTEILADGLEITQEVPSLGLNDSRVAIGSAIAAGIHGFSKGFDNWKPDLILVLGDRYEILAASIAALVMNIPIAHIHGGEITEGAFDDSIRHSITKMSHIHFVANLEYKRRVLQMGEEEDKVFIVGGLGVDNINETKLLEKNEIESFLGIKFGKKNLLVTFHPVTLDDFPSEKQLAELMNALSEFPDITIIFTMPNADPDSHVLFKMITDFVGKRSNAYCFDSLGSLLYLSCLAISDGVVGNSSSGLAEAPTLKVGTINIGDRQTGRLKSKSVIDCKPNKQEIVDSIEKLYSKEFQKTVKGSINPYGEPGATQKILEHIKNVTLEGITVKHFKDFCKEVEV